MAIFSERLRQLRKKKDVGQKEVGALLGVSESSIGKYEAGHRTPDPTALLKLAHYFGVSTDYLLGNDKDSLGNRKQPKELLEILEQEEYTLNGKLATPEDKARLQAIIAAIYQHVESPH